MTGYLLLAFASVTLGFSAPTTQADGQPLTDLAGYVLCVSNEPIATDRQARIADVAAGKLDCATRINDATTPKVVSASMSCAGRCFYRVFAVNTSGDESLPSNEVSVLVTAPASVVVFIQKVEP